MCVCVTKRKQHDELELQQLTQICETNFRNWQWLELEWNWRLGGIRKKSLNFEFTLAAGAPTSDYFWTSIFIAVAFVGIHCNSRLLPRNVKIIRTGKFHSLIQLSKVNYRPPKKARDSSIKLCNKHFLQPCDARFPRNLIVFSHYHTKAFMDWTIFPRNPSQCKDKNDVEVSGTWYHTFICSFHCICIVLI